MRVCCAGHLHLVCVLRLMSLRQPPPSAFDRLSLARLRSHHLSFTQTRNRCRCRSGMDWGARVLATCKSRLHDHLRKNMKSTPAPATSTSRSRLALNESVLATIPCAPSSASTCLRPHRSPFTQMRNRCSCSPHANQDHSRFMITCEMTRTAPLVVSSHLQPIPPSPSMKLFTMSTHGLD